MNKWPTFDDDDDGKGIRSKPETVTYITDTKHKKNRTANFGDHNTNRNDKQQNKRMSEMEDAKRRKELFRELRGQVQALGASQFRGWDRRNWVKEKEKSMGMKTQKNQKMPRKIMNGIRKKQTEKILRREKEAKEGDVVLGTIKKKRKGGRFDMKKKKKVSRR